MSGKGTKRKRDEDLKELVYRLVETLEEQDSLKKQKLIEIENKMMKEMSNDVPSANQIESGIKNILKDIMHPVIEVKKIGNTEAQKHPIFSYTINIPYPNYINYKQLEQLQSLKFIVSVQVLESKRKGCISVQCIVSVDSSLKIAYGRKDLLKSKPNIDNILNHLGGEETNVNLAEVVKQILVANLNLDNYGTASERTTSDGMRISILTQGVVPPISIDQIRRVKTHGDVVIINCFFKAKSSNSTKIQLILEMFDEEDIIV